MIGSRNQEYPYQCKTVSLADAQCRWLEVHTLVVFLPKDLIEIKNLFVYLAIGFDKIEQLGQMVENTTPPELRKIGWIGGSGGRKMFNTGLEGDTASVKYDFSNELELFGLANGKPTEVNGTKTLKLEFGCGNSGSNGMLHGKVRLWKVDMVYTTRGIR